MEKQLLYHLAADTLLIVHVLFVAFIVLGFVMILLGTIAKWNWTRNLWFRSLHLAAIVIVVIQTWFGVLCPLTTWEMYFREKAGDMVYAGSFIQYWLHRVLFYQAEAWVFALCYTVFGVMVIASWYFHRPHFRSPDRK